MHRVHLSSFSSCCQFLVKRRNSHFFFVSFYPNQGAKVFKRVRITFKLVLHLVQQFFMLKEGIIILSSSLHAWEVLAVPASREPTAWRKTARSARRNNEQQGTRWKGNFRDLVSDRKGRMDSEQLQVKGGNLEGLTVLKNTDLLITQDTKLCC